MMRKEIEQDQSVLGVALTGFPSCPPSERGKSRVLIRRPRKITEKYSLGLLPTAGGEVAQGKAPIKKSPPAATARRLRRQAETAAGAAARRRRRRSICPARRGQGSKAEKRSRGNFFAPGRTQGIQRGREAMGRKGSDSSS